MLAQFFAKEYSPVKLSFPAWGGTMLWGRSLFVAGLSIFALPAFSLCGFQDGDSSLADLVSIIQSRTCDIRTIDDACRGP